MAQGRAPICLRSRSRQGKAEGASAHRDVEEVDFKKSGMPILVTVLSSVPHVESDWVAEGRFSIEDYHFADGIFV